MDQSTPLPGSAEWLQIITASKVAAIVGVSKWESPRSMWHIMKGDLRRPETEVQSRGHYLEEGILAWWRDQHPEAVGYEAQPFLTRPDVPWAGATPDARASLVEVPVLVDAKSAVEDEDWGAPGTDDVPIEYVVSSQWQMAMCPEAMQVRIPMLGPYLTFSEYVVERDDDIIADLMERAFAFFLSLEGELPPPLDDHVATFTALKAIHPDIATGVTVDLTPAVAAEYVNALAAETEAGRRAVGAKSAILEAMGTAQYAKLGDVRIARRQPHAHGVALYCTAKPDSLPKDQS